VTQNDKTLVDVGYCNDLII